MQFAKWHGLGNDYILIHEDELQRDAGATRLTQRDTHPTDPIPEQLAQQMCDRHFGIGGDGILLLGPSSAADARMIVYNPDGSQAEMCGNGIRMAARFLRDGGYVTADAMSIETLGGVVRPTILEDGSVRVDMGQGTEPERVELTWGERTVTGYAVSMGNPHVVVPIEDAPAESDLRAIGQPAQTSPTFPAGVNVEIVHADGTLLDTRVWERGVGETLACGSGACAVGVVASQILELGSSVTVRLPGGELRIDVDDERNVVMTGPARHVYTGTIDLQQLADTAAAAREEELV